MSEDTCTLCGLPTPDPPITDEKVEGQFCCSGCLQVHELLQELDPVQAKKIREETIARKHSEWEETEAVPDTCAEAYFKIEGMHCATCESFIESMARRQEGIYKSEASYAAEVVKIYYDPDRLTKQQLPVLISRMGYKAHPMDSFIDEDNFLSMIRLVIGGIFSVYGLIVYIIMLYPLYITGHHVIPFAPVTRYFFLANVFLMTSVILFFTGFPILRGAWVSLSVMQPNMDLLIAIAAVSAYLFSTGALFLGINELYFDVTMSIIMVVSLGNYYESYIKKDKNSLLTRLMENRIKQARVQRNGQFEMIDLQKLEPGDQVLVNAGERIPIDGIIVEGQGVVDEALITGESLPVSKTPGDRAISGTVLTQNALTIQTDQQVQSTIEQMIRLMWDIQATHSGTQRLADKIASYFVPAVLLLGVATFILHFFLIAGSMFSSALLAALAVLIVSCPCALGLATPLAVASGLRDALKKNIIFKSSAVFEQQSDTDIIAFDKTGTLTTGRMKLLSKGNNRQALACAGALEQYSSHPVAKAIAAGAGSEDLSVKNVESEACGVWGDVDGITIYCGQPEWIKIQGFSTTREQHEIVANARAHGNVPTAIAWDHQVRSIVVVGDEIREEAVDFISSLRSRGKKIAIITGDSEQAARPLEQCLHPDFLFTEAQPESKTKIINELKKTGSVTMVGDGSNDALALANADLGIAFGDLTAIAAESAQIVIPGERLWHILVAFKAMEKTKKRIKQNLGWAFLYNITAIPLAIAGLINPLYAALAMAGSSLLVVTNSSRKMELE